MPDDGKALATEMDVGPSSTVVVSFSNAAGSIGSPISSPGPVRIQLGSRSTFSGLIEWMCSQEVAP